MTPLDNQTSENAITPMSKSHLRSISGWMRFIAIVYIIFSAFLILAAVGGIASAGMLAGQMSDMMPIEICLYNCYSQLMALEAMPRRIA